MLMNVVESQMGAFTLVGAVAEAEAQIAQQIHVVLVVQTQEHVHVIRLSALIHVIQILVVLVVLVQIRVNAIQQDKSVFVQQIHVLMVVLILVHVDAILQYVVVGVIPVFGSVETDAPAQMIVIKNVNIGNQLLVMNFHQCVKKL
jgi:hypothetical protein